MIRYLSLVVGLCLLSLIAVYLLSPTPEMRLERALSRLPPSDALFELGRIYDKGNRDPNLLVRRAELLVASGEFDEARRTYQDLAANPGNALLASDALAQLELDLGNREAATQQLEIGFNLDSSPERLDALARLLELGGAADAERALLTSVEPIKLTDRAAARLLELQLALADMVGVEQLLRARVEVAGPDRGTMRSTLTELLVGDNRAGEAAEVAARWFALDNDAPSLAIAVERLLDRGDVRQAKVLGTAAVRSGLPGAHAIIPVFAIAGHGGEARALLLLWLTTRPELTAADQDALLDYSRTMNDFTAARAALRAGSPLSFEPAFVLGVLQSTYVRFGPAALPEFRRYLTPQILATDPLFGAELALSRQDQREATKYLEAAAASDLEFWEIDAWSELARRITSPSARERLRQRWADRTAQETQ